MLDLSLIDRDLTDQTAVELETTDERLAKIMSLAAADRFPEAAEAAQALFEQNIYDFRILGAFLFGVYLEKGMEIVPELLGTLVRSLSSSFSTWGPQNKKQIHADNMLKWLLATMLLLTATLFDLLHSNYGITLSTGVVLLLGLVLGIAASVLGVNRFLTAEGLDLGLLLGFAALIGFGGAIISLLISKPMAKWSTKAQVINDSTDPTHRWLVGTVQGFAQKAGIGMPEVAIYDGTPNAFATGAFKNSALVAVSTGLLQSMSRDEVEAVIGHEVAHVANGDMVTLTLIQGVMNTFVVFLSRVIGYFVDRVILKNERDGVGIGYIVTTIVLDIVLGILAAIIVAWFSRQREFRADAGAAALMGRMQPMINALARLGGLDPGELPKTVANMGISSRPSGLMALMSSHPPVEDRIRALQAAP